MKKILLALLFLMSFLPAKGAAPDDVSGAVPDIDISYGDLATLDFDPSAYALLGVSHFATADEIEAAGFAKQEEYRHRNDPLGVTLYFKVNLARCVLTDPARRAVYDKQYGEYLRTNSLQDWVVNVIGNIDGGVNFNELPVPIVIMLLDAYIFPSDDTDLPALMMTMHNMGQTAEDALEALKARCQPAQLRAYFGLVRESNLAVAVPAQLSRSFSQSLSAERSGGTQDTLTGESPSFGDSPGSFGEGS